MSDIAPEPFHNTPSYGGGPAAPPPLTSASSQQQQAMMETGQPRPVAWSSYFGGGGEPAPGGATMDDGVLQTPQPNPQASNANRPSMPYYNNNSNSAAAQPLPSFPVAVSGGGGGGAAGVPEDVTRYVLDLERQNHEFRDQITFLQAALRTADESNAQQAETSRRREGESRQRRLDHVFGHAEDEKNAFLSDVLGQVELVIQAHRNKANADMQRYKHEAETAKAALRSLRESIEQEGMDLTLAPAIVRMQEKYQAALRDVTTQHAAGVGGGTDDDAEGPNKDGAQGDELVLKLPQEAQHLVHAVAADILARLSRVREEDDVTALVRQAVTVAFRALVQHFTAQVVDSSKEAVESVAYLREEMNRLKEQHRYELSFSEQQRVLLVERTDLEVQALRDELHAYHVASTTDDVQATMQEKALNEYTNMLVEARAEAEKLRRELDQEKTHCAQVCLRLKSSLQKRNQEFEKAVVDRAEEVVRQRDQMVADLQKQLDSLRNAVPQKRSVATQAGTGSADFAPMQPQQGLVTMLMKSLNQSSSSNNNNNSGYAHHHPHPSSGAYSSRLESTPTPLNYSRAGGGNGTSDINSILATPYGGANGGVKADGSQSAAEFEKEVWRKTQELMERFRGGTPRTPR